MDPEEGLKALGLTHYEAAVYVSLLGQGALEARAVSRLAGVPSGRIYDALHALAERGIVEIVPGRPKRFAAVAPTAALSDLLAQRKTEMDASFDRLAQEVSHLEQTLGPRAADEQRPTFNVSIGEQTGHAFIASQLGKARGSIDASLRFDVRLKPRDVEVFRELAAAVGRGVNVRAVMPEADLGRAVASPLADRVLEAVGPHVGEGLHVRVSEQAVVPFTIIDREAVALGVKNPLQPDRYFAFLFVHDPPFALSLANKFEEIWSEGEDVLGELLGSAELAADAFQP